MTVSRHAEPLCLPRIRYRLLYTESTSSDEWRRLRREHPRRRVTRICWSKPRAASNAPAVGAVRRGEPGVRPTARPHWDSFIVNGFSMSTILEPSPHPRRRVMPRRGVSACPRADKRAARRTSTKKQRRTAAPLKGRYLLCLVD